MFFFSPSIQLISVSLEVARHITANNYVDALYIGNRMPRVKKNSSKRGTITVVEISIEEFAKGKAEERENNYLKYPAII